MSTPTLTEAEVIATGRTVLARIYADSFTWPSSARGCDSLRECCDGLRESRRDYLNVKAERIHPGTIFPELEHDDDAYNTALRKLADDVLAWARAAVLVVTEHCGQ